MQVSCGKCGISYDDARRFTFCPHNSFMTEAELGQKDAGIALVGKTIRFAHEPDGPDRRVQSVGFTGMVTLHDMTGEFAPHLFVVVDEAPRPC